MLEITSFFIFQSSIYKNFIIWQFEFIFCILHFCIIADSRRCGDIEGLFLKNN